jgi:hypothetical protein
LPWSSYHAWKKSLNRSHNSAIQTLAVTALRSWTYNHVGSLRAMCALDKLKFNHIAFIQGPTWFSYDRGVMDKDIWTVTAPDKTISPNISEPFHFANHRFSSKCHP